MNVDPIQFPNTHRMQQWFENEKKNGLVDIKFVVGDVSSATVESFSTEVLACLMAPTIPDPDLF